MVMTKRIEIGYWLDEDTVGFINKQREKGFTYREIATDLSRSGWVVTAKEVAGWVSQAKQKASK